ncbi:hypothetical protein F5887DRAFT_986435 [Amanita rubescens]|nr:hypothetical protein F5887DRAFT_986435 [Amanita rubescens]
MSESDEITLWCWVLGDSPNRVFSVSLKRSDIIYDLQIAIKGEKPPFKDIAADSLDVYKFQLPLESFSEDCAQSIRLEDGQPLDMCDDISCYWMKDPGKVLSVILPPPTGTTLIPSSQNSNLSQNSPSSLAAGLSIL